VDRNSASRSEAEAARIGRAPKILIADDNRSDVFLIREALKKSGIEAQIYVANDGEQTIRFLDQAGADSSAACPDLILLDINMPRYKGGAILRHLRSNSRCASCLVLIVTSSNSDQDREEMEALGANGYFRKPSDFSEFMKLGQLVSELLALNKPPPSIV
jgi:CheY-like chemotaxis protein